MNRGASPGRPWGARVLVAGLAGCLACTGGSGTTGKKDGTAGASGGASLDGGGGAGGARDAGSGGGGGSVARDAGGVGIAVRGVVYDKFDVPIDGAQVRIGSTIVQTGADGSFEIDGVVPPYDLDVWMPSTIVATLVDRYVGLTRVDPALHFYVYVTPPHQSTLNVTLSAPLPSNEVANCQFANPTRSEAMGQASGGVTSGSTFSLVVGWYTSATSISGTLSCLVYKNNALDPTGFDTFASLPVTLTDGTPTSATLTLTPVSTGTLTVDLTFGSSKGAEVDGYISIAGGAIHPAGNVSGITSSPTSILIPEIPGSTLFLNAYGGTSDVRLFTYRTGFPVAARSVDLTLPAPVPATSPSDGATMVDTATPLTWSAPAGTAVNINIRPGDLKNAEYNIYTSQGSATIPDLTAQGIPLPSGAVYSWQVTSFGPSLSVDDIASPTESPCLSGLPGTCDFTVSKSRNITLR